MLLLGAVHEATGVSRRFGKCRCCVAAYGARAAGDDASRRIPRHPITRVDRRPTQRSAAGSEGDGLRRGRERDDRLPLGRGPLAPYQKHSR